MRICLGTESQTFHVLEILTVILNLADETSRAEYQSSNVKGEANRDEVENRSSVSRSRSLNKFKVKFSFNP